MITDNAVIVAKDGLSVADLDGEAVVLAPQTGDYYGLNTVGARALELADSLRPVSEIVQALFEEFEAPQDVLRNDVLRFFEKMEELGLVEVRYSASHGD